jgi:hypothetical protein
MGTKTDGREGKPKVTAGVGTPVEKRAESRATSALASHGHYLFLIHPGWQLMAFYEC